MTMAPKRFLLRTAASAWFLLCSLSYTFARDRTVTGKVTNSRNQPLSGVTVVKKGTTQGTVTDENGEYRLPGIRENTILTFSFVGMATREIHFSGQSKTDVGMLEALLS